MKKLLTILLVLVWAGVGWGQTWGGTAVYQFADSMDVSFLSQNAPTDNNGGDDEMINGKLTASDSFATVIRPVNDPRTGGYTQDSAYVYIAMNTDGNMSAAGDTIELTAYILQRTWGEGDNTATAADAGEVSWDSSVTGTTPWTNGGAQGSGTDREASPVDTIRFAYVGGAPTNDSIEIRTLTSGFGPDTLTANTFFKFKIPGNKMDDFFTYGVLLDVEYMSFTRNIQFWSDDHTTQSERPYIEGWETAPAAGGGTTAGAATVGAATVGSQ